MPVNILNFDADFPEVIYGDSSFIVNFCVEGVKYHSAEIIDKYVPILRRATADILMLANVIVVEIPTESTLKALDFIERYHLLPRDAIHLSTALSLGVHNIVTTNLDFTRVEGINVYTCNPKAFGGEKTENIV